MTARRRRARHAIDQQLWPGDARTPPAGTPGRHDRPASGYGSGTRWRKVAGSRSGRGSGTGGQHDGIGTVEEVVPGAEPFRDVGALPRGKSHQTVELADQVRGTRRTSVKRRRSSGASLEVDVVDQVDHVEALVRIGMAFSIENRPSPITKARRRHRPGREASDATSPAASASCAPDGFADRSESSATGCLHVRSWSPQVDRAVRPPEVEDDIVVGFWPPVAGVVGRPVRVEHVDGLYM